MAIEKLEIFKVEKEELPFTPLRNSVLQKLNDPLALAIWCYLSSFPRKWKVIKKQVQNHFGVGEKAIRSAFSLLHKLGLVEYSQDRLEHGYFQGNTIYILNGSRFPSTSERVRQDLPHPTGEAENGTCRKRDVPSGRSNKRNISIKENKKKETRVTHLKAKSEKQYADVSSQSTSAGYQCETPEESQRRFEENMKAWGKDVKIPKKRKSP